jgi:UPF0716 protein FxsA
MLLPLLILFIVVPIAELAVIIQVGQAIGVWWTIAILVADSVAGSLLLRSQGLAAWRRLGEALGSGRVPTTEVVDGGLVIFGGACLLTPGFITDLFGALLLLPPTRAVLRRLLVRRFALRMMASVRRSAFRPAGGRDRASSDVDGQAYDVPDAPEPRIAPGGDRP